MNPSDRTFAAFEELQGARDAVVKAARASVAAPSCDDRRSTLVALLVAEERAMAAFQARCREVVHSHTIPTINGHVGPARADFPTHGWRNW